ncbi:Ferric enterobactin transport ATP-binding protein fepC [Vibrio nigripulchritudo SFn27]|uniref:Ferric enterobactin transport ATP-binding protein fepC n=1 Tax=Vibrio nigripulchritudo TaxID=28173 RepID=U4KC47_9VIBR|nr:ABC transporter ATP-binding protein [Vibrio nigripulchritudo]CCN80846.1 Ferric enterobactin transport ATP-binding protein fepC [Vibrio nigripulchritudo BLFn1]CCN88038.1 Ferric enterobactin transport ATP-binding protein fepC [Vibrio nigripulchritudo SFn27]CCN96892.1 Ferric enterobactin transport ATP-binding protein fepC [Vibrio nigripulchritudo ENn2]CCO43455.1 Ferric enterobactin transport ATP-binding protein fepC [Vibrio nigripulchritudo SFn135]CCO51640.1 Ferric enterobactin transport ATP-b
MTLSTPTKSNTSFRLKGENLKLAYENRVICEDLELSIPEGKFTVIVGPNGCGKSTLLRSLCRLLKPVHGQVCLNGKNIQEMPAKELARELGLLPQSSQAPDGIRVVDLIARGRYPHQKLFKQWSPEDQEAVSQAMEDTGVTELAERQVDELSGGQKQRVWIAMVLAQKTPTVLLDEPTTYLDVAHQIELLELFRSLNREKKHTIVAVLHDLNQACRYADHLIAFSGGEIVAQGEPKILIDAALVKKVFGLDSVIIDDPVSHTPMIVPLGK